MSKYLFIQVKQREGITWFQLHLWAKKSWSCIHSLYKFYGNSTTQIDCEVSPLCKMLTQVMRECINMLVEQSTSLGCTGLCSWGKCHIALKTWHASDQTGCFPWQGHMLNKCVLSLSLNSAQTKRNFRSWATGCTPAKCMSSQQWNDSGQIFIWKCGLKLVLCVTHLGFFLVVGRSVGGDLAKIHFPLSTHLLPSSWGPHETSATKWEPCLPFHHLSLLPWKFTPARHC